MKPFRSHLFAIPVLVAALCAAPGTAADAEALKVRLTAQATNGDLEAALGTLRELRQTGAALPARLHWMEAKLLSKLGRAAEASTAAERFLSEGDSSDAGYGDAKALVAEHRAAAERQQQAERARAAAEAERRAEAQRQVRARQQAEAARRAEWARGNLARNRELYAQKLTELTKGVQSGANFAIPPRTSFDDEERRAASLTVQEDGRIRLSVTSSSVSRTPRRGENSDRTVRVYVFRPEHILSAAAERDMIGVDEKTPVHSVTVRLTEFWMWYDSGPVRGKWERAAGPDVSAWMDVWSRGTALGLKRLIEETRDLRALIAEGESAAAP